MKGFWAKQKEKIRTERNKLRPMNGKERVAYIRTYYSRMIIFTIFFSFLLVSLVLMLWNNRLERVLNCALLNNIPKASVDGYIEDGFGNYLSINPKKERIFVDSDYLFRLKDADEHLSGSLYLQKFVTSMADHMIDIVIAEKDIIDHYSLNGGAFLDLELFLPKEDLKRLRPYFYYTKDETGASYAYGLKLSSTHLARHEEMFLEDALLSVPVNVKHSGNALEFIRYAFP